MDIRYRQAVLAHSFPGDRNLKLLYSPLHGVGLSSVLPVLSGDGFCDVEVYAPHAEPDGSFPNVPEGIANPENPVVFDSLVAHAELTGAELVLASDPDADRIGCAARIEPCGPWQTLSGNQIGVLLAEYILRRREADGTLNRNGTSYIVKTLVTTEMLRRVADQYGVRTVSDVLTGFKWISGVVDELGSEGFVFGCEEAHGYMVGDYIRDKDAAVAAMLLAELAAEVKRDGKTLHGHLNDLYRTLGYHAERTIALTSPGPDGMKTMQIMTERLRMTPPRRLGDMLVTRIRDYLQSIFVPEDTLVNSSGRRSNVPRGDLLTFALERDGNFAAVRPSGTEAKLKFYLFTYLPPTESQDLEKARALCDQRLSQMESDLLAAASGR
jgi:phosphoglucomutase/phosphomannomutase